MTDTDIIPLLCPVKPYELDRKERRQWEDLVSRVSGAAVASGLGRDLLLYVYLAGFYHGVTQGRNPSAAHDGLGKP